MKEETKELVRWIKCMIITNDDVSHTISQEANKKFENNKIKAINFLDSLSDIELRLCLGGYIQDRNGTPCGHGDRIKFFVNGEYYCNGLLQWNATNHRFFITKDKYGTNEWSFSKDDFEKVIL